MLMLRKWMAALLVAAACILPPSPALGAVDPWAAAAQALGIYGMYKTTLTDILRMGNNVHAQMASRRQDIKENGLDKNPRDAELVDGVMKQLIARGDYAMQVNSLPFLWAVNDSGAFNAACYPTNYISVNRGLVRGLDSNEDVLAAVLAHEMVHGLRQHSAHNYAQAVAQAMGITFIGMEAGTVDWQKLNGLVGYSIARNVTLPTEQEADEEGFFIMASAGFNPGGPAAAMARMGHYLRYETTDMYEFDSPDRKGQTEYSDHPETADREKRMAELLTEYSCGHVAVGGKGEVLIDGEELLTAPDTGANRDNTRENAYFIAGGLAKAFHDHEGIPGWQFRALGNGRMDFLDGDRAYRALKDAVKDEKTAKRLEAMVASAYGKEALSGARAKLREREQKRREELEKIRREALDADKKFAEQLRYNSDVYSDYGMDHMALEEMSRAMASRNQDNMAECYVIRGRAKAVAGDFEGAIADADRGIAMDGSNLLNYLNRADIFRMMGDRERAMRDCDTAREIDSKSAVAWLLTAELRDEMEDAKGATEAYRMLHELSPKAEIPMEYLRAIDPEAAETARKAEEARQKKKKEATEAKGE